MTAYPPATQAIPQATVQAAGLDAVPSGAAALPGMTLRLLPGIPVITLTLVIVLGLAAWAWQLASLPQTGRALSFSLLAGTVFGVALQRSRFCFYCITRDYMAGRDARGLLGLVVALAVGTLGYHAIFGAFLPIPAPGRLPPGAHIGPLSWVLAMGAGAFGLGMALSGSCISAHLYRLGEGAIASLFALVGALVGFGLGFASWNTLYAAVIRDAPVVWLPNHLGYGGSLALQLAALGLVAAWLLRGQRLRAARQTSTVASGNPQHAAPPVGLFHVLFGQRWPTYAGGLLIAGLGTVAYFRVAPLGVTAELGSIARTLADSAGALPAKLEGLDGFAGCATIVKQALLSNNGVFVAGLVLASLASALLAGDFRPVWPSLRDVLRNFAGGVLMGWGGMLALGCTVGTLLSGIMAGAVSGWVFAACCVAGAWLGWRLRSKTV